MNVFVYLLIVCSTTLWSYSAELRLVVGTHVKDNKGLHFYSFNEETGKFGKLEKKLDIFGSSVLSLKAVNGHIFSCGAGEGNNEVTSINLSDYSIKQVSSRGLKPCYVSVSPNDNFLFVANIQGNSVCSFKLDKSNGQLSFISKVEIPAKGKAFKPHAAVPSPDGKLLFVPDIAGTRLNKLSISSDGKLSYLEDITSKNFKGPRHFCFDSEGKTAYLVNQTGEAVTVFKYEQSNGNLIEIGHEQSLPNDKLNINNHISEIKIHPSGKFVYVANRGHDSLTLYHRNKADGLLKFIECAPSQGSAPWSFDITPSGKYLLCSNNKTGNIAVFSINQKSGKLEFTGENLNIDGAISSIKLFY